MGSGGQTTFKKDDWGTDGSGNYFYLQFESGNPNNSLTAEEYASINVGDTVTAFDYAGPLGTSTVEAKSIFFDPVSMKNQYQIMCPNWLDLLGIISL